MAEKKERLSFRQAMAYTRRGYAIWFKAAPEVFLAAGADRAVTALTPYVPLYFTARLVNAIAGGGGPGEVWPMLAALLISTALAGAARAAASNWNQAMENSHLHPAWNRIFFEKLLSMDFCDVDDAKTQALFTQIRQNNNWSGWGLTRLHWTFGCMVEAVLRILGALALSVSLFTLPVPADSQIGRAHV